MPTPPPPEWSNEKLLQFLELYESERIIWDPRDKNHKLKHKLHDAWNRISAQLDNTPIEDLKWKKRSLMATFRPLLKKKKASIRSGAGADDVFQPIWFPFEIMERFLGTLYDVEETINTEQRVSHTEYEAQSPDVDLPLQSPSYQQISSPLDSVPSPSQSVPSPTQAGASTPVHNRPKKTKKRPSLDIDEAQNKISQTLDTLNQVLKDKRTYTNENNEDECDLYAKLLAKKLRKYPESMRGTIMYQIDGLFLQNPYPTIDHQVHRPSSVFSNHSSLSSSQSQYSDYQVKSNPPIQQSQFVYTIQPPVQSDLPVQISIPEMSPEMNEISASPSHVMPQTPSTQYILEPRGQPRFSERNVTPHEMNVIERAYWNATQK